MAMTTTSMTGQYNRAIYEENPVAVRLLAAAVVLTFRLLLGGVEGRHAVRDGLRILVTILGARVQRRADQEPVEAPASA